MDYSKKGIKNKQRNIKSNTRKMVSKTRISLFRVCVFFVIFLAIVGGFAGLGFVKGLIDSSPDVSRIDVIPTGFTTNVYDNEGNIIETLIGAHSNREYVEIEKIPKVVQKAFVAIEDERFYDHDGIDVKGIFRAFFLGLSAGEFDQGASTITQQLIKNQIFEGGREKEFMARLERKIQEQYLAIQLENDIDKDTILEYYLNTINLGSGTYGVQTASKRYFNKDVSDLTLSEATVIAGITQSPVYLSPITNPEKNKDRRILVLNKMLELEFCSQEEYDKALADDVYARIKSVNKDQDGTSYYSYFVDALIDQVLKDLTTELGWSEAEATNKLYSGGLSIYTTQKPTIQEICDEIYSDESYFPGIGDSYWELTYALSIQKNDEANTTIHYHSNDLIKFHKDYPDPNGLYVDAKDGSSKFSLLFKDKEDMQKRIDEFKASVVEKGDTILGENANMTIQPQSSFVVMDQQSGEVAAIIGGRGEKIGNRTLNRATNTVRQPGSTFKIVSTYLPALDSGAFTLASTNDDAGPYYYPGTTTEVSNWRRTNTYQGLTTIRKAIWDSMNIIAVKTLAEVTPQVAYDYLLDLGFTSMVDSMKLEDGRVVSDINLPMALGGLTKGVSNIELTAAFASIANGGNYIKPTFYTKILDSKGEVLIEKKPRPEQVMKESTAWLLTNAMEDVVKIGTGTSYKLNTIDMPVSGKTGTTSDNNDLWFSGYTPYYTATIWSGFDNNRSQTERTYHRTVWRTIMEKVHMELNLETKSFTIPSSIVTAKICTQSGKLAVEGLCDSYVGGSTTKIEYFAKGTEPTEYCDVHVRASICTESKALAHEYCPQKSVKEGVYLNKTEIGVTSDTPYVLPSESCTVHEPSNSFIDYDYDYDTDNIDIQEILNNYRDMFD